MVPGLSARAQSGRESEAKILAHLVHRLTINRTVATLSHLPSCRAEKKL